MSSPSLAAALRAARRALRRKLAAGFPPLSRLSAGASPGAAAATWVEDTAHGAAIHIIPGGISRHAPPRKGDKHR